MRKNHFSRRETLLPSFILDYIFKNTYMLTFGHKYPPNWKQSTMLADIVFVGNRTCQRCWFDIWWQKEHDTDTNETLWRVSTRMQQRGSASFCLASFYEIHSSNRRKKITEILQKSCICGLFWTCCIYRQQTNMLLICHIM